MRTKQRAMMGDAVEAQRAARIEARRRRLAARESRAEWASDGFACVESGGDAHQDAGPETSDLSIASSALPPKLAQYTAARPLTPVSEHSIQIDARAEQGLSERASPAPAKKPLRAMNRDDHRDMFGMRASVAEGLVDAAPSRPSRARFAHASVVDTAGTLDLDFASVERASARIQRSADAASKLPPAALTAEREAAIAHKAAVLSADQANRPARPGAAAVLQGRAARAAGKAGLDEEEARALDRLMLGPREEADGITRSAAAAAIRTMAGGECGNADNASGSKDGCAGQEKELQLVAANSKAMDRLARQNDELRKLAEAQVPSPMPSTPRPAPEASLAWEVSGAGRGVDASALLSR